MLRNGLLMQHPKYLPRKCPVGPNYLSPNKKVWGFTYLLSFQPDFAGGLNKHTH